MIRTGKLGAALCSLAACGVLIACSSSPENGRSEEPLRAGRCYTLIDLGVVDAVASDARAINERGQVMGFLLRSPRPPHAFFWEDGVMTDVGSLGGPTTLPGGLNDRGQMVGWTTTGTTRHAFLWQNGVMTDLGTLVGPAGQSTASAINNAGWVVGGSSTASGQTHAALFRDGTIVDLGVLPGDTTSVAELINDHGQVFGLSTSMVTFAARGFLWEKGAMTEIPVLPGTDRNTVGSFALGKHGDVAGTSYRADGTSSAFLYSARGELIDLGALSGGAQSFANAINARGWVVGGSNATGESHATLWRKGRALDLGVLPGTTSSSASAINDHGQIAGAARADTESIPWLWERGELRALPGNGGVAAMNERGELVGSTGVDGRGHAALWRPGPCAR